MSVAATRRSSRVRPSAGDDVVVEALEDGELRVRRSAITFEVAFGALTGAYPPGYLDRSDEEDARR
jgi:hypothetical protein